jgi:opacity protein-like surface antigen
MKLKRLGQAVALITAAAACASQAFAADPQPATYFGVHGGINDLRGNWGGDVTLGPGVTLPGTVGLKRGSHFGLQAGRQWQNWRFEGEYQHGTFDLRSIQLGPVTESISESGSYDTLMANAYRTASLTSNLSAFGGLGVGWGRVKLPQMGFASTGCNCFADSSKSGFAWQARAGVEYAITPNDNVFAQYSYIGLPKPSGGGTPSVQYERKNVSTLGIGYRRTF